MAIFGRSIGPGPFIGNRLGLTGVAQPKPPARLTLPRPSQPKAAQPQTLNASVWQPPHLRIVPGIPAGLIPPIRAVQPLAIHSVHGQPQPNRIPAAGAHGAVGSCCSTTVCRCGGHSHAHPFFAVGSINMRAIQRSSKGGLKGPVGIRKPEHRRKAFINSRFSGVKFFKSLRLAELNPVQKQLKCSRVVPGGLGFWDGNRNSLGWNATTLLAFPVGGGGGACQLNLAPCTGAAQERDHINPWVVVQAGLPIYTHCTGVCHYSGVRFTDAQAEYNDATNLQWSCSPCNALKNGPKGYDGNGPRYAGDCPGVGCPIGTGNTVQTG